MKPFSDLLPLEEALQIIEAHIEPIERKEEIPIDEALGRIAAENVIAGFDTPSFDRATVDGYALRASDTYGATPATPKRLRLADRLYAGSSPKTGLSAGDCIQISTGAVMPEGADAVIMVEETMRSEGSVTIFKSLSPQDHIGLRGVDIRKGERIIEAGQQLNAGKIGMLASQGLVRVMVYAKPAVAVMPTGKEVVDVGTPLKASQLYDINSHSIMAVVRENGGIPVPMKITGDSVTAIKSSLKSALTSDMVVTSGGSSMGEKDLIINVLEEWGRVFFHGVKVKPGKPSTFALVQDKPVLGLPGFPTSCLLAAVLLLGPAVRKMARVPPRASSAIQATLSERVAGSSERVVFQTVKVAGGKAYPVFKDSGAITTMAYADGYIVVPLGGAAEAGSEVAVTPF